MPNTCLHCCKHNRKTSIQTSSVCCLFIGSVYLILKNVLTYISFPIPFCVKQSIRKLGAKLELLIFTIKQSPNWLYEGMQRNGFSCVYSESVVMWLCVRGWRSGWSITWNESPSPSQCSLLISRFVDRLRAKHQVKGKYSFVSMRIEVSIRRRVGTSTNLNSV